MRILFKEKLKSYFSNIWFLWALCLILNIITFLVLYLKIHPGNKTLALHYNVLTGVEWYGKGANLYFIPGAGLAILAANFILYKATSDDQNFFSALAAFASLCAQLILLTAVLFLATVN
jgi:hypothetical protein